MEEIEFIHYENARDIISAFIDGISERAGLESNENDSIGAMGERGVDVGEMSKDDMVAAAEEQGCWAFSDNIGGVIHVWLADDLPLINRIEVFAHELTHLLSSEFDGTPEADIDTDVDDLDLLKEETRCDLVAEIAMIAYEKATELRVAK